MTHHLLAVGIQRIIHNPLGWVDGVVVLQSQMAKALGDGLEAWSHLALPKAKEPAVTLARAARHATYGKHSLKLTFAGGTWPAAIASMVASSTPAARASGSCVHHS